MLWEICGSTTSVCLALWLGALCDRAANEARVLCDPDHCPKNCSNHGRCFHGYCYCDDGFYGIDCSNSTCSQGLVRLLLGPSMGIMWSLHVVWLCCGAVSCPGTFCYMDTDSHRQVCHHCCHAGYSHTDGEWYVEDHRKVPCSLDLIGEMHGICDGFGNCQCAPPYMTRDCSVRTFNGILQKQWPLWGC